ncbi:MAG: FtsX-like permease family protein [Calditrichaeota bacterium]|nr:FtsX-like permease family protein [Calditrichota bacterium]
MKIYRNLKISRRALLAHKMRTVLALLGIIIGVSAVIIMVAIGRGAQKEVLSKIEEMGTNLIVVNAGQVRSFAGRRRQTGNVITLTLKDARAISLDCPSVHLTAPIQSKKLQVKYSSLSTKTSVVGTTSEFQEIRNFHVRRGAFFTDEENRASLRVAVLGQTVVKNLFENEDPIGETIRIRKIPFEVIGEMEAKGVDINGVDQDDQIIIPINTALRRVFNLTYLNTIYVQAKNSRSINAAVEEVTGLLRERHHLTRHTKPDDFTIQNQADVLKTQKEATNTFTMLIGSIAAISLLVGGIGILAIMLMVIRERTNEIGLRMAVGARKKDIFIQFSLESSILTIGGGFLGIILGVIGSITIGLFTTWSASLSIPSIAVAFAFSLLVGIFFGVYPAHRASLLDPIEALRSE